jgi:hypothetical protein
MRNFRQALASPYPVRQGSRFGAALSLLYQLSALGSLLSAESES